MERKHYPCQGLVHRQQQLVAVWLAANRQTDHLMWAVRTGLRLHPQTNCQLRAVAVWLAANRQTDHLMWAASTGPELRAVWLVANRQTDPHKSGFAAGQQTCQQMLVQPHEGQHPTRHDSNLSK